MTIPPLRERVEDIDELAEFFVREASAEIGTDKKVISEAAMNILRGYDWPGNVRQLRNCVRTMTVMNEDGVLEVGDIPPDIHRPRQLAGTATPGGTLDEMEKQAIVNALAKTQGNREKAAKILGIGERTLYRKIKEYNL